MARGIYRLGNIKNRGAQIVMTDARCEKFRRQDSLQARRMIRYEGWARSELEYVPSIVVSAINKTSN